MKRTFAHHLEVDVHLGWTEPWSSETQRLPVWPKPPGQIDSDSVRVENQTGSNPIKVNPSQSDQIKPQKDKKIRAPSCAYFEPKSGSPAPGAVSLGRSRRCGVRPFVLHPSGIGAFQEARRCQTRAVFRGSSTSAPRSPNPIPRPNGPESRSRIPPHLG